jgi:hypothetical protein
MANARWLSGLRRVSSWQRSFDFPGRPTGIHRRLPPRHTQQSDDPGRSFTSSRRRNRSIVVLLMLRIHSPRSNSTPCDSMCTIRLTEATVLDHLQRGASHCDSRRADPQPVSKSRFLRHADHRPTSRSAPAVQRDATTCDPSKHWGCWVAVRNCYLQKMGPQTGPQGFHGAPYLIDSDRIFSVEPLCMPCKRSPS